MIEMSKRVNSIFKELYDSDGIKVRLKNSFNYVMKSNETRLGYLNRLFKLIKNNELNQECCFIFDENIDYLYCFISGEYNNSFVVPKKYFDDKDDCLIVPNNDDLEYLFKLIKSNKTMYDSLYKNKKIMIELPQKTFNQNMIRVLSIEEYNLAHLLGLTDSEPVPDENKNILKKYFMSHVENNERYGEKISERLLNWILSEEGKKELRRLNNITINFINEDKVKYPNNYDSNGNIKSKSLEKFKIRFKEANGFEYPIIKYSRYITKCINSLNFFHMNDIYQVILDYNASDGKKDEKDIFIVNSSSSSMYYEIEKYIKLNNNILRLLTCYSNGDDKQKKDIQILLEEIGLDVNDKDMFLFTNLIQTYDFVRKHGINPNLDVPLEKIRNVISEYFDRNINLIGFDTEFNNQIIELSDSMINSAHCDTSISLTMPELISEYYNRGRPCFLDKIYDSKNGDILRLSIPVEEIRYLEQMNFLEQYNLKDLNRLRNKLVKFTNNYFDYKKSLDKRRK